MGLIGKLQAETLIKAPAHLFQEVVCCRPHHISNVCPEKIEKVHLHEGDWGSLGSVIEWSYIIGFVLHGILKDGNNLKVRESVEAIDEENKSVTFKIIEGDLMKEYKSFRFVFQAIPRGDDSWIHWTLEYEKLHQDIPAPIKILGFVVNLTEHIDDHLAQA